MKLNFANIFEAFVFDRWLHFHFGRRWWRQRRHSLLNVQCVHEIQYWEPVLKQWVFHVIAKGERKNQSFHSLIQRYAYHWESERKFHAYHLIPIHLHGNILSPVEAHCHHFAFVEFVKVFSSSLDPFVQLACTENKYFISRIENENTNRQRQRKRQH